jgi:hypothetical protein
MATMATEIDVTHMGTPLPDRRRKFGMTPGDLECPTALELADGRVIAVQRWTTTVSLDAQVQVVVAGLLLPAEHGTAKRLKDALAQERGHG